LLAQGTDRFQVYIGQQFSLNMQLKGSIKIGNKYQNPVPTGTGFNKLLPIIWEQITSKAERVPLKPLGPFTTDAAIYQTPAQSKFTY
jgi:hypothetical protein